MSRQADRVARAFIEQEGDRAGAFVSHGDRHTTACMALDYHGETVDQPEFCDCGVPELVEAARAVATWLMAPDWEAAPEMRDRLRAALARIEGTNG